MNQEDPGGDPRSLAGREPLLWAQHGSCQKAQGGRRSRAQEAGDQGGGLSRAAGEDMDKRGM